MSRGDIYAFLKELFASEGGKNTEVINKYGYIGKYQFGEDALIDLGYYKPDGTKNRNAKENFEYDWVGNWTGKNGIYTRSEFLDSESAQDTAAKEWVRLLCKRMKQLKLQSYLNQSINGVQITESGIIAAAHLKGYGSAKHPGVIQYLRSNGKIDPTDANGTPVSLYMEKFSDYELGCCGSVTGVFVDKDKKPIVGVNYQIKAGQKVIAEGRTNTNGATKRIEGLTANTSILVLIRKLGGGFKEIKSFIAKEETAIVATLRSATRLVTTHLEKHIGTPGVYQRHSENTQKNKRSPHPAPKQHTSNAGRKLSPSNEPDKQRPIEKAKKNIDATEVQGSPTKAEGAVSSSVSPSPNLAANNDLQPKSIIEPAAIVSGANAETQEPQNNKARLETAEDTGDTTTDTNASQPSDTNSASVETVRNEDGHPISVVELSSPVPAINPSIQKLEEILMANVNYGMQKEAISGPVAAEKVKAGSPISPLKKNASESLGKCYKYVKIALLASGMSGRYLGEQAAKNAGPQLKLVGYRNLLEGSNQELTSPYDAPVGAVIVYDSMDGSPWGHIEVRVSDGFASDYFSERPRTSPRAEKRENAKMVGRERKVIGVWVKD